MFVVWIILYMHAFIGYSFFGKKYANEICILPKTQTATLNKPWCILIMQEGEKNVLSPLKQSIQPSLKFFLTVG